METENYGSLIKNLRQKMGLTRNQVADSLALLLDISAMLVE
ncbi:MAG: hypothetical protein ACLUGJ_01575 [Blautia wexlerae]